MYYKSAACVKLLLYIDRGTCNIIAIK